ncbi:pentatricopeptide repeat-containing protein At1g77405 [Nymphaea colorata]|nr:pentatricopeptide repeat-containing protein At1g77405 [Nymphaea colorata]XP_031496308.1 pentatricopeptide repeat-containing protein At1g77405 [Nymphaea colorata]
MLWRCRAQCRTTHFIFSVSFLRSMTTSCRPIHTCESEAGSGYGDLTRTFLTAPSDSCIFSRKLEDVMAVIVDNKGFEGIRASNLWNEDLVAACLRSFPRIYFQSERSVGCQKGFRRRSPLKQRNLWQEYKDSSNGVRIYGPAAYRDQRRVLEGVNKALNFYTWVESGGGFTHTDITCREMAYVLAKANCLKKLWQFLHEMSRRGAPNELVKTATITAVIKVLGEEGLVKEALMAFYRMKQFWCKPDVVAYNTVIVALCRIGDFKKAKFLVDKMGVPGSRCPPDAFTYTILIGSYCKHSMKTGCLKAIKRRLWEANHLFRIMLSKGLKPDTVTYNCLIDGLCKNYRIGRALELLDSMITSGCSPNRVTYNSFIRYYSTVNEIDKAIEMLVLMTTRNHGVPTSSSYTPIIHALCESGRVCEAREFLVKMVKGGSVPRVYTYNLVIDSLHSAGESGLPDEVRRTIEDQIDIRFRTIKNIKPITSDYTHFQRDS